MKLCVLALCLLAAACSRKPKPLDIQLPSDLGPRPVAMPSDKEGNPLWMQSSGDGIYKVGKPYKVNGVWYFPKEDTDYDEVGYASWYGQDFHDKLTANGETFDMSMISAAHKTLPLPCVVKVTNLENNRALVVRVNDRGPFVNDRILDVSKKAAELLGFADRGITKVRIQFLKEESMTVAALARNEGTDIPEPLPAAESGTIEEMGTFVDTSLFDAPKAPADESSFVTINDIPQTEEDYTQHLINSLSKEPSTPQIEQTPIESTPAAPPPIDMHFIQVGTFSQEANAQRLAQRLQHIGSASLQDVVINGRRLYKVRIGPYGNKVESQRVLQKVMDEGFVDALIVKGTT